MSPASLLPSGAGLLPFGAVRLRLRRCPSSVSPRLFARLVPPVCLSATSLPASDRLPALLCPGSLLPRGAGLLSHGAVRLRLRRCASSVSVRSSLRRVSADCLSASPCPVSHACRSVSVVGRCCLRELGCCLMALCGCAIGAARRLCRPGGPPYHPDLPHCSPCQHFQRSAWRTVHVLARLGRSARQRDSCRPWCVAPRDTARVRFAHVLCDFAHTACKQPR